ncbi:unnamed protein product [Effrenium voratum]|nr:unnamed protein product [Effrenium voratum]
MQPLNTVLRDGSMQAKTDPTTFIPLTFKMGGIYHICYSDDGTFDNGHSDIVPQRIEVYGIYDLRTECAEDEACLTKRPYNCFLRRQAYNNMEDTYDGTTSCVVDYSYEGAGYSGLPGRGSWTGAFATSYDTNGMVTSEVARTCGSADLFDFPASFLCNADTSCGAITDPRNPYIAPDATNQYSRMTIPAARPDLVGPEYKAYAVAVCYCPDFQRCDSYSPDYVQQVCPNGFEAEADGCSLDFTGAAPQHRFALRVECPSTACAYAADSRVKVVQQAASNNLPSWDPMSGCGSAVHGINALGMQVLPADDNPDVATMHGGMRQDYKIWNFKNSSSGLIYDTKTSGFQFRIKKTRLIGLVVAGFGCMCILGLLGVWSQFEIHLERRSLRKELRKEEHHAASKLAQVGMELWSEYRDDIHESHEAQMLMKILNTSYGTFEAKVKSTVDASSKQLGLDKEKAAKLADTLLHLVADQQQQGLKHTKRLVDHLVEVGKRAVPLEKAAEKEVMAEVKAEEKLLEEDRASGDALPQSQGGNHTELDDPLHGILEGFFWIFDDYEREFSGKPREQLKKGNKAFDALEALNDKMDELTEGQVAEELDKIDLETVGAGLGSGRVLPARDIVEELLMIGSIPHQKLRELQKAWKDGKEDSVSIFEQISEMHEQHLVPSGWLQKGVDEDEREEVAREEAEEKAQGGAKP